MCEYMRMVVLIVEGACIGGLTPTILLHLSLSSCITAMTVMANQSCYEPMSVRFVGDTWSRQYKVQCQGLPQSVVYSHVMQQEEEQLVTAVAG